MAQSDIVLETRNLSKNFNGTLAVSHLNFCIQRGDIHALIGPNGAGKTTVFNLLTGFLTSSSGQIFFDSQEISGKRPAELAIRGIVRSFQISAVFPALTALENVRLALSRKAGFSYNFWRSEKMFNRLNEPAMDLLSKVGIKKFYDTPAGALAYGHKRVLEIATTLAADPMLMLLDEPTQGMGREDVDRITELIRLVAKKRSVLMVEHNLKVVSTLADRVTVLQRGSILAEGKYDEVSKDPLVIEAYMGVSADA